MDSHTVYTLTQRKNLPLISACDICRRGLKEGGEQGSTPLLSSPLSLSLEFSHPSSRGTEGHVGVYSSLQEILLTRTFCSRSPCCIQRLPSAASTFRQCPVWTHYRTLRHSVEASTHSVFIDYALGLGFLSTAAAKQHTQTLLQPWGDKTPPCFIIG